MSPDGRENPFVSAAADTKDWKDSGIKLLIKTKIPNL